MFSNDLELEAASSIDAVDSGVDDREPLVVDWDELEHSRWRGQLLFELTA